MTTFEKFDRMARGEMDIRVAPLKNITAVDIKGANGYVTIGVPRSTAQDLIDEKPFVGGLLLADEGEFNGICEYSVARVEEVIESIINKNAWIDTEGHSTIEEENFENLQIDLSDYINSAVERFVEERKEK